MSEEVLVTGGTGFVAGWCIVELLRRGYRVRTTLRDAAKESRVRAAVARQVDAGDRLRFAIADLTNDQGWDAAAAGCTYVLHVASPMSDPASKGANALIAPAREGSVRVLRAATHAGAKRVVMTSSCAAANRGLQSGDSENDETVWTSLDDPNLNAYRRSKVLAERAAWDYVGKQADGIELVTVLPSAIFGPVLAHDNLGSVQLIERQLQGRMPGIPRVGFCVVDVRDLAAAHIDAMTAADAAGQRFIAAGEFVWMEDIAHMLRARLGERAAKVPTRRLPNMLVKLLARFIPAMQPLVPMLGRRHIYRSDKAKRVLGFAPRPVERTLIECAESLLGGESTTARSQAS